MANQARSIEFARVGPVHFQPLEKELMAVQSYLSGRVLNAGCGYRAIDDILRGMGATEIVNVDLESNIPGAVIAPLSEMPFDDGGFDVIYSNAVLEHVPLIHDVMREFDRVLRPGGLMVLAIPFLQPFHADPWDYRRFTQLGLRELAELHGLDVVDLKPVHGIAQTLGWIAWEWALEKGGWRRPVVYPIVWLATRLFHQTDHRLIRNANTFQIVLRKPAQPENFVERQDSAEPAVK